MNGDGQPFQGCGGDPFCRGGVGGNFAGTAADFIWWKTLSTVHRQPFLARKEDDRRCNVKEGQLADTEALAARHVAHVVPCTGDALYAPVHGDEARRDNKQAVRKDAARSRQAAQKESCAPEELDEQARKRVQSQRRRGQRWQSGT